MTDAIMNILQPAINMGLPEKDFWDMTVAEIERYVNGAAWRMRLKAQFDYNLSNLIGISVGRIIASDSSFPTIAEAYPGLFEEEPVDEAKLEEQKTEQSINNFLAFAQQHNARKKGLDNGN